MSDLPDRLALAGVLAMLWGVAAFLIWLAETHGLLPVAALLICGGAVALGTAAWLDRGGWRT